MHAGQVLSEAARRKIAERERRRQQEEARAEADLSGSRIAELKRQAAALLLPGESVARAMKRLRPAKGSKGMPLQIVFIQ